MLPASQLPTRELQEEEEEEEGENFERSPRCSAHTQAPKMLWEAVPHIYLGTIKRRSRTRAVRNG